MSLQRHFVYGPVALRKDDSSSEGFNVDSYLKYVLNESVREKTSNLGSDQVRHKLGCSHRRWIEAGNFGFRK